MDKSEEYMRAALEVPKPAPGELGQDFLLLRSETDWQPLIDPPVPDEKMNLSIWFGSKSRFVIAVHDVSQLLILPVAQLVR